ncbi:MAG: hypothetical protein LBB47_00380 [Spirochaetaceae bacterium]|nr:hypothetical protein [Spirochaetaceae bacterium]
MTKIIPKTRAAIVYVTAKGPEAPEFIAGELEFIMANKVYTLIDLRELDKIRKEQCFQVSGGLPQLRLRALSTGSGQALAAAPEKY